MTTAFSVEFMQVICGVLDILFVLELNEDRLKCRISVRLNVTSHNGKGCGDQFVNIPHTVYKDNRRLNRVM